MAQNLLPIRVVGNEGFKKSVTDLIPCVIFYTAFTLPQLYISDVHSEVKEKPEAVKLGLLVHYLNMFTYFLTRQSPFHLLVMQFVLNKT